MTNRWLEGRLADYATVKARLGWKGLKAEEYVPDGPIFLAAPNLRGGRVDFDNVDHIPAWRYDESPEIQLRLGDILLVKDGSTLGMSANVRTLPAPSTVNGSIAVIRANQSISSVFLYYLINSERFQKLIWVKRAGLGVPHLFQADLRKFTIPVPSPPEQQGIAEILSTLDETIDQTEALIDKHQKIRAGMMHDLFTRGVIPNGHLRPTRAEAPNLYKESPIGWLPKEWEVQRLGTILRRCGGYLQTGPFGSQLHSHEYTQEGVPVVMPQDINDGLIDTNQISRIVEKRAQDLARHRMRVGDVVIARRGDLSRAALISQREEAWLCGTGCFLLRLQGSSFKPAFAALAYLQDFAQRQIAGLAVGTTMPSLNNSVMEALLFPLVAPDEQTRICDRVASADFAERMSRSCLGILRSIKQGLMQDLLTGRVPVDLFKTAVT